MSIDSITLFDVNRAGVTPDWLASQFRDRAAGLSQVVETYRSFWRPQEWTVDNGLDGVPQLWGPGGFSFEFKSRMMKAYHIVRFRRFACQPEVRTPLQQAWRLVAELVESPRAIYTHELMPYEGETLTDIETNLRREFGPPARDFDELCHADEFGPRAWYIDDFADLQM
jgi:hypothetical protein